MSKTNITINGAATNLAEAVGVSEQEFADLQVIINETIGAEVKRANEDPESPGVNLLNIMSTFNDKCTVGQILLISAFFASEVLQRNERQHNPLQGLLEALQSGDLKMEEANGDLVDKEEAVGILTAESITNPEAKA